MSEEINVASLKKWIIGAVVGIIVIVCGFNMFGSVDSTEYVVKQAAVSGNLSCVQEPGIFGKMFGKISEYDRTGTFYFSKEKLDGGDGEDAKPLGATFQGNSTAEISGYLKYRLPANCKDAISLHRDFGNKETVRMDLIRNAVAAALKQTGPQFTAEESYIDRRPEFTKLVREILEDGEFLTTTLEIKKYDAEDSSTFQMFKISKMTLDSNGKKIITKPSVLKKYGIEVIALDIKDFDFDPKTDELIKTKKESEQKRVAAKSMAEKAKQDAITERELGNARISKAKADEDVKKISEVTQAQKEFEVAELNAKKSIEEAKSIEASGKAEAAIAKLKVQAGLSPLEKATIDKETRIGVAAELAKVVFPTTMIISGSSSGGSSNPFDAIGLKSFYELSEKMSANTPTRAK
jgi:regulator of protease activity HflC (stomatin/prohibitin superfamily)